MTYAALTRSGRNPSRTTDGDIPRGKSAGGRLEETGEAIPAYGDALARYLEWIIDGDERVRAIRRLFGGKLLSPLEAFRFLTAPLSGGLSLQEFTELGIDPLSCPARARWEVMTKLGCYTGPPVTWEAAPHVRFRFSADISHPKRGRVPKQAQVARGQIRRIFIPGHLVPADPGPPHEAMSVSPQTRACQLYCLPGSLTDFLPQTCRELGDALALRPEMVMTYLLTGAPLEAPMISVIAHRTRQSRHDRRAVGGAVLLAVHPSLPGTALASFWNSVRAPYARRKSPSEAGLAAFQFALRHTPPNEPFAWEQLARKWRLETRHEIGRDTLYKQFHSVQGFLMPEAKPVDQPSGPPPGVRWGRPCGDKN